MSSPTTTTPNLSGSEVAPFRIATAFLAWAALVLADLTTLWNAVFNGGATENVARAVVTSLSGAYGGSGTGVLTASANSAFGTQDGVSTLAVGDAVLLPAGTTNITTAADAGIYIITALGAVGSKWVLTRASSWASAAVLSPASIIKVSEGTLFAGTTWKSFAVKGSAVVDTNDPLLYPEKVSQSVTLLNGFVTKTNVPIRSLTGSGFAFMPATATGTTSTVTYRTGAFSSGGAATAAGAINTGSVSVSALEANGSTVETTDDSTGVLTIFN